MAFNNLTFSVGAILTAVQVNNMQSNFTAVTTGDSGAPLQSIRYTYGVTSYGSWFIAPSGTYTIPAGFYNTVQKNSTKWNLQLNVGGTWYGVTHHAVSGRGLVGVVSDGVNMRFNNTDTTTLNVFYQRV